MPMHVAACCPIHRHQFPLLFWATWPRTLGAKSMPMLGGYMHPQALAYFPPTFPGHVAQTNRGKYVNAWLHAAPMHRHTVSRSCLGQVAQQGRISRMPLRVDAPSPMHCHTFPLLVWATWPNKYGGKYAHAWGCTQPHALAYASTTCLGHVAQTNKGKVCP